MKSGKRNWLKILGLAGGGCCGLVCVVVGAFIFFGPPVYNSFLNRSSLPVGDTAPDFELATLSGQVIRLSQLRGQPVLLAIGASWCPDCQREAPLLQQLHERHPELAILMVDSKEARSTVQAFVAEFGLTYPIALDPGGAVNSRYRVVAIPTELLIDKDGVIRARLIERVTEQGLQNLLGQVGIEP